MEIGKTMSVCPVCLSKIPAKKVVGTDGNIYMEKQCWEHGQFRTLIWEGDLDSYMAWAAGDANGIVTPARAQPVEKGCPYDCGENAARPGSAPWVLKGPSAFRDWVVSRYLCTSDRSR